MRNIFIINPSPPPLVMSSMKYRKKPVEVEAFQWLGYNEEELWSFVLPRNAHQCEIEGTDLKIQTLEGIMRANKNDWIIRGVKGELYPCKPDIFEETYEPVTPTNKV